MFALQIHSVDSPQPLSATSAASGRSPGNRNLVELRGIVHLFRNRPSAVSSLPIPSARTTLLFVVAVPNYLSPDDFLLFCGSHIDHFSELLLIRNDAVEDRYSVLIRFDTELAADGFNCNFNGKRFKPSEAEVCHIFFTHSVEYTESEEIASIPPPREEFTELPTCPVCLERLDQDTSGIQSTLCDHSFSCSCISKWTYLSCQVCRLCHQQDEGLTCAVCGAQENLWICVICSFVGCGRYEQGHAIRHWRDTQHRYFLKLETQQVWDYVGDNYVHRLNQSKVDGKSVMTNSRCLSPDGDFGTCGYVEDSGISGALFSSKVEAIADEYNHLLATQLENQRQHYETLLAEAKSRRESSISGAVEKAIVSKMQDIQYELEKGVEVKKIVADKNRDLMKNQEILRKKLKDVEEREVLSLKSRDEKIADLEEQIRDLKVYIEAQKTLASMTDSDGIKEGTVLPVQSNQSFPGNPKGRTKSSRKRT